jgi:hypothetical protein
MTIFTELLRALDGSMGGQDRNILLFVNSCAARPQSMSILGNMKAAYILFSCMTLLQNLDLGFIKYLGKLYIKQIVQKAACMLDSGKDVTAEIKCSASNTCQS